MDINNKNVLVVGAAKSGISAAKLLVSKGARVTLADSKQKEDINNLSELSLLNVTLFLGKNAGEDIVKNQSLIVKSPGVPLNIDTFKVAKKLSVPVIGELELASLFCKCPIAAITGTNGKTTTTALAGEIIKSHIKDTFIAGNIGTPFTGGAARLTKDSFAVVEASSFQLENITVFKPDISVILNITPDHLDRHKTMESYIKAKTNIIKNADKNSFVILNYDDSLVKNIKTIGKCFYFSLKTELQNGAYVKCGKIMLAEDGMTKTLAKVSELKIIGDHNIQNALAASLTAHCAGIPTRIISEGLVNFKGVSHRLQFVSEVSGIKYYNDSKATNVDAAIKALMSMNSKTVLIAGGYDKNASFDALANHFKNKVKKLIAIGETKDKIINAAEKAGFSNYEKAETLERAIYAAAHAASAGDCVLLSPACASWDMFENYEKRGDAFIRIVNGL